MTSATLICSIDFERDPFRADLLFKLLYLSIFSLSRCCSTGASHALPPHSTLALTTPHRCHTWAIIRPTHLSISWTTHQWGPRIPGKDSHIALHNLQCTAPQAHAISSNMSSSSLIWISRTSLQVHFAKKQNLFLTANKWDLADNCFPQCGVGVVRSRYYIIRYKLSGCFKDGISEEEAQICSNQLCVTTDLIPWPQKLHTHNGGKLQGAIASLNQGQFFFFLF